MGTAGTYPWSPNQIYGKGGSGSSNPITPNLSLPETFGSNVLTSMEGMLPALSSLIGGKGGTSALNTLQGALAPNVPQLPNITPIETAAGGTVSSNLASGGNPETLAALRSFTTRDIGSSPATAAAMENFSKYAAPNIQTQMNLAGLGRSGAAGQAVAQGAEQAYVPLVQQEEQNRLTAAPMISQEQNTALSNAMGYGALQRDIGTQQQQAIQSDLARRQGIAEMLVGVPLQGISSAMQGEFTPRTTTGGKGK